MQGFLRSSCFDPRLFWYEGQSSGRIDQGQHPGHPCFSKDGTMASPGRSMERAFASAKDQYAEWGVDVDAALTRLSTIAISLHCWQGDDVGGFENTGQAIG